ncbi:MAG: threonine ammonia-lyase [Rhodospirillaceae bacterium]|nr:threonine ammonia-lyase [Rhodospirillaceae bacterium]MBT7957128.1 threonine ammonia-lyase [Rhodospirillaceae bacterium]
MNEKTVGFKSITENQVAIVAAGLTTPTIYSPEISALCDAEVYLKLENLQPTGSFKVRGALLRLTNLDTESCSRGVVAMSAGNHAQGVAYHAQKLGIPATIVMPSNTPFTKISKTESLGATVILAGENLSDSQQEADRLVKSNGLTLIHPYDDIDVITGQGSVALELLDAQPNLEAIVVPIGGGGLISGISIAAKAINAKIDIFGVEAQNYASMKATIAGLDADCGGPTVAEGIAVKTAGQLTRKFVQEHVTDIFLAAEHEIEAAMQIYLREQRLVVEGAGAAPLAAVLANKEIFSGKKIGLIVSGGNVDSRLLSSVLLRGLVREGKLVRLRIEIADEPGRLSDLTEVIGASGGNIVEVNHQRLFFDVPLKSTEVDVTMETRNQNHVKEIQSALEKAGYPSLLLSESGLTN